MDQTLPSAVEQLKQSVDALGHKVDLLYGQAAQMAVAHSGASQTFLVMGITVFVLAIFVGYYVVWHVTPALHSPLMAKGGTALNIDWSDPIVAGTALTREGRIVHPYFTSADQALLELS